MRWWFQRVENVFSGTVKCFDVCGASSPGRATRRVWKREMLDVPLSDFVLDKTILRRPFRVSLSSWRACGRGDVESPKQCFASRFVPTCAWWWGEVKGLAWVAGRSEFAVKVSRCMVRSKLKNLRSENAGQYIPFEICCGCCCCWRLQVWSWSSS